MPVVENQLRYQRMRHHPITTYDHTSEGAYGFSDLRQTAFLARESGR
jgi:hypothetical protein